MKSNSIEIPDTQELIEPNKIKLVKSLSQDETNIRNAKSPLNPETKQFSISKQSSLANEPNSEKELNNLKTKSLAGKWTNNFNRESIKNISKESLKQEDTSKMLEKEENAIKEDDGAVVKQSEKCDSTHSFESDAAVSINRSSEQPSNQRQVDNELRKSPSNPIEKTISSTKLNSQNFADNPNHFENANASIGNNLVDTKKAISEFSVESVFFF